MTAHEDLRRVVQEIRAYPRPIAGCDAQFNHLLERRADLEALIQPRAKDKTACS